jgi:hypothetical protein
MSTRTKQILMVVASLASASAIAYLTKSGWVYAPTAIALLTELRTAFGLSAQPSATLAEVKGRVTGAIPPVVALLLALSLGLTSCATTPPYVGPVVACVGVDIAPYASEVAADLIAGNYADLDALAVTKGVPFVACVIRAFLAKTNAGDASRRGSDWLVARDVRFAD